MAELRYESQSYWTLNTFTRAHEAPGAGLNEGEAHDGMFDICAIEFDNEGTLSHQPVSAPSQLDRAANAIRAARRKAGGAVVVVFAHGWKNNADWDCGNFVSFRQLIASMSKREIERYSPTGEHLARRVVGVYLGWEGGADHGTLSDIGHKLMFNYYKRDGRARKVAQGEGLIGALEQLTEATKDHEDPKLGPPDNSPLIMAGHSMGGLIMETAMAEWVNDKAANLPGPRLTPADPTEQPTITLTIDGQPIAGPDLMLLINPASAASDTRNLLTALTEHAVTKRVHIEGMTFQPPLIISATSEGDSAVGIGLRVARTLAGKPGISAGFAKDMHTHKMTVREKEADCPRASWVFDGGSTPDFDQHWHQLSIDPNTRTHPNPTMLMALPNNRKVRESHTGYAITPNPPHDGPEDRGQSTPLWIFQVPDEVIGDHVDIFNFKAASMFLAMAQMSGAVASLNYDWPDLFAT